MQDIPDRSVEENRREDKDEDEVEEKDEEEKEEVARRPRRPGGPRKAHIRSVHILCRMHIYRRVHFRASDPRIGERRLFASRHLVAKPAGLFTYLPLRRARARVHSLSRLLSFPLYLFSFARERFRTDLRETANIGRKKGLDLARDRS